MAEREKLLTGAVNDLTEKTLILEDAN